MHSDCMLTHVESELLHCNLATAKPGCWMAGLLDIQAMLHGTNSLHRSENSVVVIHLQESATLISLVNMDTDAMLAECLEEP